MGSGGGCSCLNKCTAHCCEGYAHIVAAASLIKQPAAMHLLCHAKELVLSTAKSLSCMLQQACKLGPHPGCLPA